MNIQNKNEYIMKHCTLGTKMKEFVQNKDICMESQCVKNCQTADTYRVVLTKSKIVYESETTKCEESNQKPKSDNVHQNPLHNDDNTTDRVENRREEEKGERFPNVLMQMISDQSNVSLKWIGDGMSFAIVDKLDLEQNVLGKYFRTSKYPSFRRKLNRWGFKVKSNQESNDQAESIYFHEFFQRDNPGLAQKMRTNKKENSRPRSEPVLIDENHSDLRDTTTFKKMHRTNKDEPSCLPKKRSRPETNSKLNKYYSRMEYLSPLPLSQKGWIFEEKNENLDDWHESMLKISDLFRSEGKGRTYNHKKYSVDSHFEKYTENRVGIQKGTTQVQIQSSLQFMSPVQLNRTRRRRTFNHLNSTCVDIEYEHHRYKPQRKDFSVNYNDLNKYKILREEPDFPSRSQNVEEIVFGNHENSNPFYRSFRQTATRVNEPVSMRQEQDQVNSSARF